MRKKYFTRYGIQSPDEEALDWLDRARFRASFIGMMFQICGKDGYDVTIGGYEACGLSYLLEDISHDIQTAYDYYYGDNHEPGKLHDVAEHLQGLTCPQPTTPTEKEKNNA